MTTIMFIHGLWLTPLSWDKFSNYFEERGCAVVAPGWPGIEDRTIDEVRKDPSALNDLKLSDIVDYYAGIISAMDDPPILMGHSMGGLIVQLLLDRGLGAVGVAIDSAAPAGVLSFPISTMKSVSPVLRNPGNRRKAVALSLEQFRYAFANGMPGDEADAAYARYAVPAPGRVVFQSALGHLAPHADSRLNVMNSTRAPLLFIAGGADRTVPAQTSRANHRKYRNSPAITEYKEFPNRNHLLLMQDGWEEIAGYIEQWIAPYSSSVS